MDNFNSKKLLIVAIGNAILAALLAKGLLTGDQYTLAMSAVNGTYMVGQGIADHGKTRNRGNG